MSKLLCCLLEFDAHHRVADGALGRGLHFPSQWTPFGLSLILAWDEFALCSLAFAWRGILLTDVRAGVHEVHLQDPGAPQSALACR
jgi:hypothetical protein